MLKLLQTKSCKAIGVFLSLLEFCSRDYILAFSSVHLEACYTYQDFLQ